MGTRYTIHKWETETNYTDWKPGADQSEQGFIPESKAGLSTVTLRNWTPNVMAVKND